eukprot:CAMPEP_0181537460 /NCGR_PEP_ID=MMETSP1110-20121109/75360_1 /TAXON_ID=174948 /ORGANISM="Symbiodinium sp., Strain CCMP421" /LENGTH=49 /DNA_ID= /DNA_START= /DNA_END= /DNA_ORIENTATION=
MALHSWLHNIGKVGRREKDEKAPHARKECWKVARTLLCVWGKHHQCHPS